jgi:hypothetical protein
LEVPSPFIPLTSVGLFRLFIYAVGSFCYIQDVD